MMKMIIILLFIAISLEHHTTGKQVVGDHHTTGKQQVVGDDIHELWVRVLQLEPKVDELSEDVDDFEDNVKNNTNNLNTVKDVLTQALDFVRDDENKTKQTLEKAKEDVK